MNYYNEIDPKAAAWLRELINRDLIAQGEVDERSIEDVVPSDLKGFTQCHFFAGIGGWSYALRLAGWPDDKPVWTGSCPCQPFSTAGKGAGFADERHLWPAWFHLIKQCGPPVIFGEQVASKAVDTWIDLVHADLESMGYAFGSVPFSSASIGAPHIRDRNYWVADAHDTRLEGWQGAAERAVERPAWPGSLVGRLADTKHDGHNRPFRLAPQPHCDESNKRVSDGDCAACGVADSESLGQHGRRSREIQPVASESGKEPGGLGDTSGATGQRHARSIPGAETQIDRQGFADGRLAVGLEHAGESLGAGAAGPTNGFWRDADWLRCTDGKWRPVEPGTFPLAHGVPARVVRLRGYGNAINPYAAKAFIEAFGVT